MVKGSTVYVKSFDYFATSYVDTGHLEVSVRQRLLQGTLELPNSFSIRTVWLNYENRSNAATKTRDYEAIQFLFLVCSAGQSVSEITPIQNTVIGE